MNSPFNLLQEIYRSDPWKIMVCCMFLNQTNRKQVDGIRDEFFLKYPDATHLSNAIESELVEILRPLGFYNKRAKSLIRFSREWLGEWEDPIELHGIGQYARDSWTLFVENKMVDDPSDHVLKDYVKWRKGEVSTISPKNFLK
jgi:methyl-CpG-binding domain protein 4